MGSNALVRFWVLFQLIVLSLDVAHLFKGGADEQVKEVSELLSSLP
jgi:hypothetical protein